jgi:hypothetical protein
MDANPVSMVLAALEQAALRSTLLPYRQFHGLFARMVPLTHRHCVLEAALRLLNDAPQIDYGVLLACDNGLPGAEFFRRFQKNRWDAYVKAMGDPRYKSATMKGKRQLVEDDRRRVYQHAMLRQKERERECA